MCNEICFCCEKDICKCTKINKIPTKLNEIINYSRLHLLDDNGNIFNYKGWDIFTNSTSGNTFMRKLFKDKKITLSDEKLAQFTLFNSTWIENDDQLDKNKYFIENVELNYYGIYIKIGVKY